MSRPKKIIRLGTRGSKLAMFQARLVSDLIKKKFPSVSIKLVVIKTSGDAFSNIKQKRVCVENHEFAGKGLFVKEIEEALCDGRIDVAVHSLKDVPAELMHGLHLAAFTKRAPAFDLFVSFCAKKFSQLPEGSVVGTSSPRRAAQVMRVRPDLKVKPIRGNVETRLAKLAAKEFDAAVFAEAGLKRLGLLDKRSGFYFERLKWMMPAIGQGIICCETRKCDVESTEIVRASVNLRSSEVCAIAERNLLAEIGGDCHTPIAATATLRGGKIELSAALFSCDGRKALFGRLSGRDAAMAGRELGAKFVAQGGRRIIGLKDAKDAAVLTTHTELSRVPVKEIKKKYAKIIRLPLLEVHPPRDSFRSLDRALQNLKNFDWLIFTGRHAVEKFALRRFLLGLNGGKLPQIATVGKSTAEAIESFGLGESIFPKDDFSAAGLKRHFDKLGIRPKNALVVSAEEGERSLHATYVAAYRTSSAKISARYLRCLFAAEKISLICHGSKKGRSVFNRIASRAGLKIPEKAQRLYIGGKF